jgi:phage host-nuclease inhibitor protein Gam
MNTTASTSANKNSHQDSWLCAVHSREPRDAGEANRLIEIIGAARRESARLETAMNDQLAKIKADYEGLASGPKEAAVICEKFLREYCNARRAELTDGGKRKSFKFPAGEIAWRKLPPSVALPKKKAIAGLLEWLHAHKLARFIRTIEEIDKNAMLAEPDVAGNAPGVKIRVTGEKFEVTPFEAALAPATTPGETKH